MTVAPFSYLFRYSSMKDKLLMMIGVISAILTGSGYPLFNVIND